MDEIRFLTLEEVLGLHSRQLARYGGRDGILDRNVVESALAQPQAAMFGAYLHEDVAAMAAAYLYHSAAAQGFVDGNKRTGTVCAATFLALNGYDLDCTEDELYDVAMEVANHRLEKAPLADWIRDHLIPLP